MVQGRGRRRPAAQMRPSRVSRCQQITSNRQRVSACLWSTQAMYRHCTSTGRRWQGHGPLAVHPTFAGQGSCRKDTLVADPSTCEMAEVNASEGLWESTGCQPKTAKMMSFRRVEQASPALRLRMTTLVFAVGTYRSGIPAMLGFTREAMAVVPRLQAARHHAAPRSKASAVHVTP